MRTRRLRGDHRSQHSQSLEALLAHVPGLSVVMPSTPADTYGLLRAAIQDPNPVVFIENRLLYGMKGPQPPPDHIVPLGRSAVVRPGTTPPSCRCPAWSTRRWPRPSNWPGGDHGRGHRPADGGAPRPGAGPRFGAPHQPPARGPRGGRAFGIGAEIAATVAREAFWDLDAPIEARRRAATPPPYAPELERGVAARGDEIAAAVRRLVAVSQQPSARAMTRCWISLVPSPISSTFESQ